MKPTMISKLNDDLDIALAKAISAERDKFQLLGVDRIVFEGAAVGTLIKTGIALAARGGCPKEVLENELKRTIKDLYRM